MQKYLVVGCGGSGAKTQAYMIDQLLAHLRRVDPGRAELPAAWQFVTIDVPLEPEPGPEGLANVAQAGGRYIPIGNRLHYNRFDAGLSHQLARTGALGEIATWAPRDPEHLNTPISDGAGQYRAIGRMLTIQHLETIHEGLRAAIDRLNLVETTIELNELNHRITGRHSDSADDQPVVLIIGSMAGGSGASMAFDVARLLSAMPLVKPAHTAVFMLTPEVFEAIPEDRMPGAWANSLAMFGEAFAAQTGAGAGHDMALMRAMGLAGAPQDTTFGRLFPIGARMGGTRSRFGDGTPTAVFRGLARALAALMSSEKASGDFKSYTLANTGSRVGDRSILGWASPEQVRWDDVPWGSMGYAQLSMGRDRYAEYAAQRLARTAFDRLLAGHVDPAEEATGKEQLDRRLRERLPGALHRMGLPRDLAAGFGAEQVGAWLGWLFGNHSAAAGDAAAAWLRGQLPPGEGMRSADWASLVRTRIRDAGAPLAERLGEEAYAIARDFADHFTDAVIGEVEAAIAALGLPYAEELIDRVGELIQERLAPALRAHVDGMRGRDPVAAPPQLESLLQPLGGRGTVKSAEQIADQVAEAYRGQFAAHHLGLIAARLQPALADFRAEVLVRLRRELESAHRDLERAGQVRDAAVHLADVATEEPTAWPADADERIDDRFAGSANEIVITDVDRFAADYEAHLLATMAAGDPQLRAAGQASAAAAAEILAGRWDTQGGSPAPADTLCPPATGESGGNRAGWVSRHLAAAPRGGADREARPALFRVRLRPAELMARTRAWIARPAKPFSDFIDVDLRTYLSPAAAESRAEHAERVARLRSAFTRALRLARPLAAVSTEMLGLVYGGQGAEEYHFNFSEIPFEGTGAKEELESILVGDRYRDAATLGTFEAACTTDRRVFAIDVFGSYPNYSPVVFSSLFPHIAEDWAARAGAVQGFWQLRRARPLPAALPLTEEERRAMVGGWLIGVVTGRIHIADRGRAEASAHIHDDRARTWVPFPHPMLTPPKDFRTALDWMPAVIESVLLAYAMVQTAPPGGAPGDSLRSYRLLRGLYDDGDQGPTTGAVQHPATRALAEWLAEGADPAHGGTRVGAAGAAGIGERRRHLEEALAGAREKAALFLPRRGSAALPGAAEEDRPFAHVTDRRAASRMPLYRDLAADVDEVAAELLGRLDEAQALAENPAQPAAAPWTSPADDLDTAPQLPDLGGGVI